MNKTAVVLFFAIVAMCVAIALPWPSFDPPRTHEIIAYTSDCETLVWPGVTHLRIEEGGCTFRDEHGLEVIVRGYFIANESPPTHPVKGRGPHGALRPLSHLRFSFTWPPASPPPCA